VFNYFSAPLGDATKMLNLKTRSNCNGDAIKTDHGWWRHQASETNTDCEIHCGRCCGGSGIGPLNDVMRFMRYSCILCAGADSFGYRYNIK